MPIIYICSARTRNLRNPRIALRKIGIRTKYYVHIMVPSHDMAYKSLSMRNHDLYQKEERTLNILYNNLAFKF